MPEITDLFVADASNVDRFPENMLGGQINNAARALEGILARWFFDTNGSVVSSGSANAYAITSNRTISSLIDTTLIWWRANFTNTGPATLALNGLTAKDIVRANGTVLTAGDITSGQIVGVYYNSSLDDWVLITPAVQGTASDAATGLIEIATQAEMEAATDAVRASTPGRQHHHPAHPKFFAYATVSGGTPTLQASHNVTSISDGGVGQLSVTIATDFSGLNWVCHPSMATPLSGGSQLCYEKTDTPRTAGSVALSTHKTGVGEVDPSSWSVTGLGDQA